jgi:hypothetical protein
MLMANRIDQLLDQFDATLRKAFSDAVYNLRDQAQLDQIVRMLERGDVDGALRAVGLDPVSLRTWEQRFEEAFEQGGRFTVQQLPITRAPSGLQMIVQFNVRNPSAETWLRSHSSQFIREIIDDQRNMIRSYLSNGMQKGLNPRTVALDLVGRISRETGRREGGTIGLTSSQEGWVRAFANELENDPLSAMRRSLRDKRFDAALRRAAESGQPVPAELRAKMLTAYRNRALRYRAEAIARTEAMAALHQAQEEAIKQAIDGGAIESTAVQFVWKTARDTRVRDSHASMDGQARKRGELFTTGAGAHLRYPGDPDGPASEIINCRCFREPKVDFLSGVE